MNDFVGVGNDGFEVMGNGDDVKVDVFEVFSDVVYFEVGKERVGCDLCVDYLYFVVG